MLFIVLRSSSFLHCMSFCSFSIWINLGQVPNSSNPLHPAFSLRCSFPSCSDLERQPVTPLFFLFQLSFDLFDSPAGKTWMHSRLSTPKQNILFSPGQAPLETSDLHLPRFPSLPPPKHNFFVRPEPPTPSSTVAFSSVVFAPASDLDR